ncbi:MAG: hypothetical protein V1859_07685 [archaeon]
MGYDADIVIADMDKEFIVTKKILMTKCGWSVFEGRVIRGKIAANVVANFRLN